MRTGVLLPSDVLASGWFGVLSAFVAVNTLMYVTLAIVKLFPQMHPPSWFRRRNTRAETRNIDPNAPIGGPTRATKTRGAHRR